MNKWIILYVGELNPGSTCRQRMEALQELGHKVIPVDTLSQQSRLFAYRIYNKLFGPHDLSRANRQIEISVIHFKPDIIWIDKGLTVRLKTLRRVRALSSQTLILSYSPDDMMNPTNQSRHYLSCISEYDLHVTTKSYNVDELRNAGAKNVIMVDNAFSPSVHYPISTTPEERVCYGGPVGFIGTHEGERVRSLSHLAQNGISVRIWGSWKKNKTYHSNLIVEGRDLLADDYRKAICSFDINLSFLRKVNRDLQTTRSIEIPACGGFMLAERSDEHLQLFEEGKEAEFFGSDKELLDKVRYYLKHDDIRRKIGAAGHRRCITSGYSNHHRLRQILNQVEALNYSGN